MRSSDPLLIRDAEVDGRRVDVQVAGGAVATITTTGCGVVRGGRVVDAHGGRLLPGLADHHVHLLAAIARTHSLDLSGVDQLEDAVDGRGNGWLRAVGADPLFTRAELDVRWPHRPVRVQHRSAAVWMLNSPAVALLADRLDAQERLDGHVWRRDAAVRSETIGNDEIVALGHDLAALGVTHVTDATPDLDTDTLWRLQELLPQHVESLGPGGTAARKIVLSDHEPIDVDDLAATIDHAHADGRAVAMHSVSAETLAIALWALDEVGAVRGDRVEHAAECNDQAADRLAALGVVVTTQPAIESRRRRIRLAQTAPADRPDLWRHASLRRRGVRVVVTTDAPHGPVDIWDHLRAADARDDDERVDWEAALLSVFAPLQDPTGASRTVTAGADADLCLLHPDAHDVRRRPHGPLSTDVVATVVAGEVVHASPHLFSSLTSASKSQEDLCPALL